MLHSVGDADAVGGVRAYDGAAVSSWALHKRESVALPSPRPLLAAWVRSRDQFAALQKSFLDVRKHAAPAASVDAVASGDGDVGGEDALSFLYDDQLSSSVLGLVLSDDAGDATPGRCMCI